MSDRDPTGGGTWRRLANSPGLWIFLFSAVGLLSLFLGEERIQKRMQRQMQRANIATDTTPAESSSTAADRRTSPAEPPWRLTGLRWILSIAVLVGLISLLFTFIHTPTGSVSPNQ